MPDNKTDKELEQEQLKEYELKLVCAMVQGTAGTLQIGNLNDVVARARVLAEAIVKDTTPSNVTGGRGLY